MSPGTTSPLPAALSVWWGQVPALSNKVVPTPTGISGQYTAPLSPLTPGKTYQYEILASAPCYGSAEIGQYQPITFTATCTPTTLQGHVYVWGTTTPILGVGVIEGSGVGTTQSAVLVTDALGYYYYSFGCLTAGLPYTIFTVVSDSYQGYSSSYPNPTLPMSGTFPVGSQGLTLDFYLKLWSTAGSGQSFYNQDNYYGSVSLRRVTTTSPLTTPLNAYLTGGWATPGSSTTPDPATVPPGNVGGKVIYDQVTDASSSTSTSAIVYMSTGPLTDPATGARTFPINAPMDLTFWFYAPSATALNGHFAVDALLVDPAHPAGQQMSSMVDSFGDSIFGNNHAFCYAGDEQLALEQWVQVSCDLSELRGESVKEFWISYDNNNEGQGGGGYTFTAYIDQISLVDASYPRAIANGGFEAATAKPYAWLVSSPASVKISSAQRSEGQQSLGINIGRATQSGDSSGTNDVYVSQPFRIQNNYLGTPGTQPSVSIQGSVMSGCSDYYYGACGGNSFVSVYLDDRTTLSTVPISCTSGCTGTGWAQYGPTDISSLYGHVVWLRVWIHSDTSENEWTYLDGFKLLTNGESTTDKGTPGGNSFQGTLNLNSHTTYNPACPTTDSTWYPPGAFSAYNPQTVTETLDYAGTSVTSALALGIDVYQYGHFCGTNTNTLTVAITGESHSASVASTPNTLNFWVHDMCLSVGETRNSGDPLPSGRATQFTAPTGAWNIGTGNGYLTTPAESTVVAAFGIMFDSTALLVGLAAAPATGGVSVVVAVAALTILAIATDIYGLFATTTTAPNCTNAATGAADSRTWDNPTLSDNDASVQSLATVYAGCPGNTTGGCSASGDGDYTLTVTLSMDLWVTNAPVCTPSYGCVGTAPASFWQTFSMQYNLEVIT